MDAYILSFPKSGRTWVRVFLYSYFSACAQKPFTLDPAAFPHPEYPRLAFTHDAFEHYALPGIWHRLRGKYLIPRTARKRKKIVLIARDPRDVAISLFFHLSKRQHNFRFRPDTLSELIQHRQFGISGIIQIMNGWLREWIHEPNFLMLRYEDCRADPATRFHDLLRFLGFESINEKVFSASLEFASFENMQRLEASGKFDHSILKPGNVSDRNSFKVRRGKIGGYVDCLGAEDLATVNAAMAELDPRFGYASTHLLPT